MVYVLYKSFWQCVIQNVTFATKIVIDNSFAAAADCNIISNVHFFTKHAVPIITAVRECVLLHGIEMQGRSIFCCGALPVYNCVEIAGT